MNVIINRRMQRVLNMSSFGITRPITCREYGEFDNARSLRNIIWTHTNWFGDHLTVQDIEDLAKGTLTRNNFGFGGCGGLPVFFSRKTGKPRKFCRYILVQMSLVSWKRNFPGKQNVYILMMCRPSGNVNDLLQASFLTLEQLFLTSESPSYRNILNEIQNRFWKLFFE